MVSLSLFRTLLSLNCEDVMLQLVLRYCLLCGAGVGMAVSRRGHEGSDGQYETGPWCHQGCWKGHSCVPGVACPGGSLAGWQRTGMSPSECWMGTAVA